MYTPLGTAKGRVLPHRVLGTPQRVYLRGGTPRRQDHIPQCRVHLAIHDSIRIKSGPIATPQRIPVSNQMRLLSSDGPFEEISVTFLQYLRVERASPDTPLAVSAETFVRVMRFSQEQGRNRVKFVSDQPLSASLPRGHPRGHPGHSCRKGEMPRCECTLLAKSRIGCIYLLVSVLDLVPAI